MRRLFLLLLLLLPLWGMTLPALARDPAHPRIGLVLSGGGARGAAHVDHDHRNEHTQGQRTPRSEAVAARLFCVPVHPAMSDELNRYIAAAICRCVERLRRA